MSRALESWEPRDADTSSESELLPDAARGVPLPSARGAVGIAAACLLGIGAVTSLVAFTEHAPRRHVAKSHSFKPQPVTVRSLLEGPELTSLATDNVLAVAGSMGAGSRKELEGRVSQGFKNITSIIGTKDPEAFRKLAALGVSPEQKEVAMQTLSRYSDPRLVRLSQQVKAAMDENSKEGGDDESLKHKMVEKLMPHFKSLRTLMQEVMPGDKPGKSISIPVNKDHWHGSVEVDFDRRLSAANDDDLMGHVVPQARTLLKSLEDQLGDEMPKAPARMLFNFQPQGQGQNNYYQPDQNSYAAPGQPNYGGYGGPPQHESFMQCCSRAMPNPMEVMGCISSHMEEVMQMMMRFLKGGGGGNQ